MPKTVVLSSQPTQHLLSSIASYTVCTPNPRAAKALGVPFLSLDDLARQQIRHRGFLIASELVQQTKLREAVQRVLTPDDLHGTTRALTGTVREILRAGVSVRDLALELPQRTSKVLKVAQTYRELLYDHHLLDPAEVLWVATPDNPSRLLITGYPRIGAAEVAFLVKTASEGSVLLLPQGSRSCFSLNEETAQTLAEAGWTIESHVPAPSRLGDMLGAGFGRGSGGNSTAQAEALKLPSQEAEVREVLTRVKVLLHDGVSPEDVVLVARDDATYGPMVRDVAWEYEIPVVASYALAVKDTHFGAWLSLLIKAMLDGHRFEDMARLAAHPLCGQLEPEVWQSLRRERPSSLKTWCAALPDLGCLAWPTEATADTYSQYLQKSLEHLGVAERTTEDARNTLALYKIRNALASQTSVTLSLHTFLSNLNELLTLLHVPVDPAAKGVALHTPLAVFGARYDHVFILGAAEGQLPAAVRDDSVLDFHERSQLARQGLTLEGAVESAHREALSFWALLHTASVSLTLSYPEVMGAKALIPSSYFADLGLEPRTPDPKTPASREEMHALSLQVPDLADSVLEAARHAWTTELARESASPQGLYDGVIGIGVNPAERTFSASQLVTLGQCAFRWFAAKLLGLAEPEESEDELSPSLRGRLYHSTLDMALKSAKDSKDVRASALAALESAFAEAERKENVLGLPNWEQRRKAHIDNLRRVLTTPDFFATECRVERLEVSFTGMWQGLKVRGVVDRVDLSPDGIVLWDYKTSSRKPPGAKGADGKTNLDIQLPLYIQAAAPELFPEEVVAKAQYYSLTKAKPLPAVVVDEAELAQFAARVKQTLKTGNYPVEPDTAGTACTYCEFDLVCRKGPRLERKRHSGEAC